MNIKDFAKNIRSSSATGRRSDKSGLYPFQVAGVAHMVKQIRRGAKAVGCMDEQGLGKTVQAIEVANQIGASRILVICPAFLRNNWLRELDKWHVLNPGVFIKEKRAQAPISDHSCIVSYNQVDSIGDYKPDLVIIDEAHYLKNWEAKRTQTILGFRGNPGVVGLATTIFLTGTPLPNGKPNELWPILNRVAPMVSERLSYLGFIQKYCVYYGDLRREYYITGAKSQHKSTLMNNLRGSGFMLRRLKKNVLPQLPDKQYKLVVLPKTAGIKKVLAKEKQFTSADILEHVDNKNDQVTETRKEMGVEKTPQVVDYVESLFYNGVNKLIIQVVHVEVGETLKKRLSKHGAVLINGAVPVGKRQGIVDSFQEDPNIKVLIGNVQAAGVGYTMTAAHDVVVAEPSWVPGENDQFVDRVHRIGQEHAVIIHELIVEGSWDLIIQLSSERKRQDARSILNG